MQKVAKSEIELGFPFMVTGLEHKFRVIYLSGI
jgi:hypothetical protein